MYKATAGRYKRTRRLTLPLTYEDLYPPSKLFVTKNFNSFNTSNLKDGLRLPETLVEDQFIRRFMFGTWHSMFLTKVVIKRRANIIIIAGLLSRRVAPTKIYFLTGYTEEILGHLLKCPIKLELQTVENPNDVIVKYG